jgi:thymidylate kinase
MWSPQRLDEILTDAGRDGASTLWVCGHADNALQLADRFTAVFLLEVDRHTMAQRMLGSDSRNDNGRVGDTLADALAGYHAFVAAWRRIGALCVDATLDVASVAEELLLGAAQAMLRRS